MCHFYDCLWPVLFSNKKGNWKIIGMRFFFNEPSCNLQQGSLQIAYLKN
jgi:hypothetical protein